MIVTYKDFVGEVSIAQIDTAPIMANLNRIIEKREPEIMLDLFGDETYDYIQKLYASNIAEISPLSSGAEFSLFKFYTANALQDSLIRRNAMSIAAEQSVSAFTLPYALADQPDASDFIGLSSIPIYDNSGPVYMAFDLGAAGLVWINDTFDVIVSNPTYWGVIDPNELDYEDLLEIAAQNGLKIVRYGFRFFDNDGTAYLRSANFNGVYVPFVKKDSFDAFMKTIKTIIVNFVWYWYSRDNATVTTSSGQAIPQNENAVITSPAAKQMKIWNEMSSLIFGNITKCYFYQYAYNVRYDRHDHRFLHSKYKVINDRNF